MKRLLLLFGLFAPTTASGVGIVPPIIRVDQSVQPPDATAGEDDPLKTIERITKNARAVGERLKNEDSGTDTQQVQDQLLKDIDSLLKTPPPMGEGGGGGGGSPPPPMGGGGGGGGGKSPPPMGGGGGGGGQDMNPLGGGGGGGSSKRPRGDRQEGQGGTGQDKKEPMGANGQEKKEPMNGGGMPDPKEGSGMGGTEPGGGGVPGGSGKPKPDLPLDDPFTRRVWGHLPEKVRQRAMQSYREQFMPRYSEMLKQYYSTLNEKQSPTQSK